jgi:hypothetical protein
VEPADIGDSADAGALEEDKLVQDADTASPDPAIVTLDQ